MHNSYRLRGSKTKDGTLGIFTFFPTACFNCSLSSARGTVWLFSISLEMPWINFASNTTEFRFWANDKRGRQTRVRKKRALFIKLNQESIRSIFKDYISCRSAFAFTNKSFRGNPVKPFKTTGKVTGVIKAKFIGDILNQGVWLNKQGGCMSHL